MTLGSNWAFFEAEISGRSTADFLRSSTAVDAIAPLTKPRAHATATNIQAALMRTRDIDVAELVQQAPRIALTNTHLANYAGSELWTAEIARYLSALGLPLIVFSPVLGAVSQHLTDQGIVVTDDPQALADFEPDIVHINHYAAVEHALQRMRTRARLVNMIHGLLPTPGLPARQGMDRYWSVALHATAKIELLTPCRWEDVRIIPNYFDETRFFPRESQRGKRALLFSSKTTQDQREWLAAALARIGYELDHVGYGGVPSSNPAELLSGYDLVFAVARSAIEALACGARVILWDSGVIGPLVTEDNFWICVAANFSMASCVLPYMFLTDIDAADWLATQENQPADGVAELAYANLRLSNVAPLLVEGYSEVLSA